MSYAYYTVYRNGQEIEAGYGVAASCEETDCGEQIDRGLDFLCGATPGGDEFGCGGYFCYDHLYLDVNGVAPQTCQGCAERAAAERAAEQEVAA